MKKALLSLMTAGLLLGSYPTQAASFGGVRNVCKSLAWLIAGAAVVSGFLGYAYTWYPQKKNSKNDRVDCKKTIAPLASIRPSAPKKSQSIEIPQPNTFYNRIAGSMVAGAIGDALGRPTKFITSINAIYEQYPNGIRSFSDFAKKDFIQGIAPYTDNTAMAKVTAQVLCEAYTNSYTLEKTMDVLARAYKVTSTSGEGGDCGSVMRAHPFGLIFSHDPEKAVAWAAEHSYLTHSDPMAVAACAAMAGGIAYAVQGKSPHKIVNYMIDVASDYDQKTALLMERARSYARDHILPTHVYEEFLGWDAGTAIAATVYTFLMEPDSPRGAIYLGVHTPGDSDSIASMAGALVGACVGYNKLIQEWPELKLAKLESYSELMNLSQNVSNSSIRNGILLPLMLSMRGAFTCPN